MATARSPKVDFFRQLLARNPEMSLEEAKAAWAESHGSKQFPLRFFDHVRMERRMAPRGR